MVGLLYIIAVCISAMLCICLSCCMYEWQAICMYGPTLVLHHPHPMLTAIAIVLYLLYALTITTYYMHTVCHHAHGYI